MSRSLPGPGEDGAQRSMRGLGACSQSDAGVLAAGDQRQPFEVGEHAPCATTGDRHDPGRVECGGGEEGGQLCTEQRRRTEHVERERLTVDADQHATLPRERGHGPMDLGGGG